MASASRKIYLPGSRSDIRVPMREIALSGGEPPLRLYDTSGPYTDPAAMIDLKRGLDPLRLPWIKERGDVEELPGPSSVYRQERESDPLLGGVRFASIRRKPPNGAQNPPTKISVASRAPARRWARRAACRASCEVPRRRGAERQ